MIHLHYYEAALLALIIIVLTSAICYDIGKRESKSEMTELKTELKQAKAQIEVLEENQVIVYYADSWGGEQMIKVYFGNDESKKYIGESNTDSGAFRIIYDYVKNVIGWQKVYYRSWDEDGALVIDFGSHENFFYVER